MPLKDRLQTDLHQAMRNRDQIRVSVIRMLRSSIGYEEMRRKDELYQMLRSSFSCEEIEEAEKAGDLHDLLRSSVGYEEIEKKKDVDDSGVIDLISREVRQRRESIEMYRGGNRQDLVDKEEAELTILREYLPTQLSQEELADLAKGVIEEVGATGPRNKGKVMGRLIPQVRGKAEGSVVNEVVTKLLAELEG